MLLIHEVGHNFVEDTDAFRSFFLTDDTFFLSTSGSDGVGTFHPKVTQLASVPLVQRRLLLASKKNPPEWEGRTALRTGVQSCSIPII